MFLKQHSHWYVSGYKLNFHDFVQNSTEPLFKDESGSSTMFRVVVKSNLSRVLADDLIANLESTLKLLDKLVSGYTSVKKVAAGGSAGELYSAC